MLIDWKPTFEFWKEDFDITVIHIDPDVICKIKDEINVVNNRKRIFKFTGFNAHFGPVIMNIKESQGIPHDVIDLCKAKLGKWIPLTARHRDEEEKFTMSRNPPIPSDFHVCKQNRFKCVLYSAILLIHTKDISKAQYLHEKSKDIDFDLSWQYLFLGGKLIEFLTKNSYLRFENQNLYKKINIFNI